MGFGIVLFQKARQTKPSYARSRSFKNDGILSSRNRAQWVFRLPHLFTAQERVTRQNSWPGILTYYLADGRKYLADALFISL